MRIRDVLAAKTTTSGGERPAGVVTVSPDAPVRGLVALLAEHGVGALVVSRDGATVDGIVSERDVVRRLGRDADVLDAPTSAIMTPAADVRTCAQADTVDDLMRLMTEHRVRHVPVLEDDRLVGIVSIGDVVKHRIDELQFERDQLDSYVHQT